MRERRTAGVMAKLKKSDVLQIEHAEFGPEEFPVFAVRARFKKKARLYRSFE
jgi:hypothetical protein